MEICLSCEYCSSMFARFHISVNYSNQIQSISVASYLLNTAHKWCLLSIFFIQFMIKDLNLLYLVYDHRTVIYVELCDSTCHVIRNLRNSHSLSTSSNLSRLFLYKNWIIYRYSKTFGLNARTELFLKSVVFIVACSSRVLLCGWFSL